MLSRRPHHTAAAAAALAAAACWLLVASAHLGTQPTGRLKGCLVQGQVAQT